jgi:hypothetical protein
LTSERESAAGFDRCLEQGISGFFNMQSRILVAGMALAGASIAGLILVAFHVREPQSVREVSGNAGSLAIESGGREAGLGGTLSMGETVASTFSDETRGAATGAELFDMDRRQAITLVLGQGVGGDIFGVGWHVPSPLDYAVSHESVMLPWQSTTDMAAVVRPALIQGAESRTGTP